jgi:hypothetical protein
MSFTTTPGQVPHTPVTTASQTAQDARSRAISQLMSSPSSNNGEGSHAPAEALISQAAANTSPEEGKDHTSVAPEAPTPEAKEKALSPQYAALARKEKAIRSQVQELRAREAKFQAREQAIAAKEAENAKTLELVARMEKDPLGVLAERGIGYDKLTQLALNPPSEQDHTISALKAEIEALRSEFGNSKTAYEEQQTSQYKQAVNQIRMDTKQLVATNPDFETIQGTNSVDDVVELIESTFKKDGILLSVEEAAREVEDYLVEEAMKLTKIKKLQKRFNPAPPAPAKTLDAAKAQQDSKQPQMKTLTNSVGTQRPLTAKERAILAFKGELRK